MKVKQLSMDGALADLDRFTLDREKREEQQMLEKLTKGYKAIQTRELYMHEHKEGSVIIVRQELYRNNHYTAHFYRTVLGYHRTVSGQEAHLVWEGTKEWPDEPPWQTGIDELAGKRWKYPNNADKHWIEEKE